MIAKNKWGEEQNHSDMLCRCQLHCFYINGYSSSKAKNQRHFIFVALWQWDRWKTFSVLDCGVLTWNLLISISLDRKVIFFNRDGIGAAFIDWGVIQFESWVCLISEVHTTNEWARAHPPSFLQDRHFVPNSTTDSIHPKCWAMITLRSANNCRGAN